MLVGEALVTGGRPATRSPTSSPPAPTPRCASKEPDDPRRPPPSRAEQTTARAAPSRAGSAPFGGRFVPEALVPALEQLDEVRLKAAVDPAFRRRARPAAPHLHRPAQHHHRGAAFAEHAGGARVILKREDLNHTGSHKINNVLGQALLTKRMGKTRVIAETGAGQHGVATATAAALLGLDCVVYMGEKDTERQALNVARMRLLGAEVVPVSNGSADPQGRDQRGACATG